MRPPTRKKLLLIAELFLKEEVHSIRYKERLPFVFPLILIIFGMISKKVGGNFRKSPVTFFIFKIFHRDFFLRLGKSLLRFDSIK